MTTIPASQIVNVLPGVLSAGGNSLVLNGLVLTTNSRVPAGTVVSFPAATAVSSYFGALANETLGAAVYFQSYDNSTQKPGALLFAFGEIGQATTLRLTRPCSPADATR